MRANRMLNHREISLHNIEKSYLRGGQERCVLNGVSETFYPGEFIAIRGRSGSGKTTLLNIIAGIDEPTGGQLCYGEVELTGLSTKERTLFRREHIGFVFQFFNLIPTLTVEENVILPAELADQKSDEIQARTTMLLERVGLGDRRSDFPDVLSGGEQQRVAIARAVLLRPMVILADEPTGNLDQTNGQEILGLLDELRDQSGTTLIMVTHSHSLADRAERVFSIDDGVLTALVDLPGAGGG